MKKKLITASNFGEFILEGVLQVGPDHILSPGARDAARNKGVSIVYGAPEPKVLPREPESDGGVPDGGGSDDAVSGQAAGSDLSGDQGVPREVLGRQIVVLLKTEFGLSDPEMIQAVTLKVLKRILMAS